MLARLVQTIESFRASDPSDSDAIKACCAAAYGFDLVELLLGDSYHPGGAALTRRLADVLELRPDELVLDVASGIGTTALLLAAEREARVLGVDLGQTQIDRARARASESGLDSRTQFEVGDAERLPVGSGAFDVVVCECALCTFPDKEAAVAELARALRPGGRVGITDVWLDPDRLDQELRGLAGRVACFADARPIEDVVALVDAAGLVVTGVERHDQALAEVIGRVVDRLRVARLMDVPALSHFDIGHGIELARRAAKAVDEGNAGYMLISATSP